MPFTWVVRAVPVIEPTTYPAPWQSEQVVSAAECVASGGVPWQPLQASDAPQVTDEVTPDDLKLPWQ